MSTLSPRTIIIQRSFQESVYRANPSRLTADSPIAQRKLDRAEILKIIGNDAWYTIKSLAAGDLIKNEYNTFNPLKLELELLPPAGISETIRSLASHHLRIIPGSMDKEFFIGYRTMCLIHMRLLPRSPRQIELQTIWLHPVLRYQGLGTKIIHNLLSYLQENNIEEIRIIPSFDGAPYWERFGIGGKHFGLTTMPINKLAHNIKAYQQNRMTE